LRLFTSALARVSSLRKRKTWAKLLGCSETLHVDGPNLIITGMILLTLATGMGMNWPYRNAKDLLRGISF